MDLDLLASGPKFAPRRPSTRGKGYRLRREFPACDRRGDIEFPRIPLYRLAPHDSSRGYASLHALRASRERPSPRCWGAAVYDAPRLGGAEVARGPLWLGHGWCDRPRSLGQPDRHTAPAASSRRLQPVVGDERRQEAVVAKVAVRPARSPRRARGSRTEAGADGVP